MFTLMVRAKKKIMEDRLLKWIPVLAIVLSFFMGTLYNTFNVVKNVATIPYVDSKHEAALKYTDTQVTAGVKAAIDYADKKGQENLTEIRALGAKQDLMLDTLRVIQTQSFESNRRR